MEHPPAASTYPGETGLFVSLYRVGERAARFLGMARNRARVSEAEHAELLSLSTAEYDRLIRGQKAIRPELVDKLATTLGYSDFTTLCEAMEHAAVVPISKPSGPKAG